MIVDKIVRQLSILLLTLSFILCYFQWWLVWLIPLFPFPFFYSNLFRQYFESHSTLPLTCFHFLCLNLANTPLSYIFQIFLLLCWYFQAGRPFLLLIKLKCKFICQPYWRNWCTLQQNCQWRWECSNEVFHFLIFLQLDCYCIFCSSIANSRSTLAKNHWSSVQRSNFQRNSECFSGFFLCLSFYHLHIHLKPEILCFFFVAEHLHQWVINPNYFSILSVSWPKDIQQMYRSESVHYFDDFPFKLNFSQFIDGATMYWRGMAYNRDSLRLSFGMGNLVLIFLVNLIVGKVHFWSVCCRNWDLQVQ